MTNNERDLKQVAIAMHRKGQDTFTIVDLIETSGMPPMGARAAVRGLQSAGIFSNGLNMRIAIQAEIPRVVAGVHHKAEDWIKTSSPSFPICYEIAANETILTSQVFKDLSKMSLDDVKGMDVDDWEKIRVFFEEMAGYGGAV